MIVGPDLQHERRRGLGAPIGPKVARRELDVITPHHVHRWGERRGRGKSHKFQSGMHSPGDRTLPLGAEANKYLMSNRRLRERERSASTCRRIFARACVSRSSVDANGLEVARNAVFFRSFFSRACCCELHTSTSGAVEIVPAAHEAPFIVHTSL